ncbi:sulfotransferase domain-containing protein [candidate division KSB1 bacterium]|nr:sulfotransferase domain-containing protein [candidate division KSB1 bacterium]
MKNSFITIVSGLPRSGTSMMMKMLEAGGMAVVTDNLRTADEDNPKGYYEFERVKQIESDKDWLPGAQGKAVKMISELLKHLPPNYQYRVVFMRRKIEETLASQKQMLVRRGQPTDVVSNEKLAELFRRHLERTFAWLEEQSNFAVLFVEYADVLQNVAAQAGRINEFLDKTLNVEKMIGVVDQTLYRQRK